MALTKEQEDLYRKTMEEARVQYEQIDAEMEKEIQKTREILAKLQESKKSFQQIYQATAQLLGIEVEINDNEKNSDFEGKNEEKEEKKQEPSKDSEQVQEKSS